MLYKNQVRQNLTELISEILEIWDTGQTGVNIRSYCKRCHCTSTEHHTMKAYWWSGDIAPHILDFGTIWR